MTADPALAIAVEHIAGFEGFRSFPYKGPHDRDWAIGFGFSVMPDGSRVNASTPKMTMDQALPILDTLVGRTLVRVRSLVKPDVKLTNNQAAAMTSLAYNIGTGALASSTLLRLLNSGEVAQAAVQFGAWIYDEGTAVEGLRVRRAAEEKLFLTPDTETTTSDTADVLPVT